MIKEQHDRVLVSQALLTGHSFPVTALAYCQGKYFSYFFLFSNPPLPFFAMRKRPPVQFFFFFVFHIILWTRFCCSS